MKENLGTLEIKFSNEELREFRNAFSKEELVGARPPEAALADQLL